MENEKYFVHVIGPDEIHGPFEEIKAHREANEVNKVSVEFNYDKDIEDKVFALAIVVTCKDNGYEYLKDY